jgi:hypothetical protein
VVDVVVLPPPVVDPPPEVVDEVDVPNPVLGR